MTQTATQGTQPPAPRRVAARRRSTSDHPSIPQSINADTLCRQLLTEHLMKVHGTPWKELALHALSARIRSSRMAKLEAERKSETFNEQIEFHEFKKIANEIKAGEIRSFKEFDDRVKSLMTPSGRRPAIHFYLRERQGVLTFLNNLVANLRGLARFRTKQLDDLHQDLRTARTTVRQCELMEHKSLYEALSSVVG